MTRPGRQNAWRRLATALTLVGGLIAQASQPASGPSTARHPWDTFATILWLHGGPPRDAALFTRIRAMGFTAVSVDQDEDPAVPGQHGLRFYLEQAAGKGHLELRDAQYAPKARDYARTRATEALSRPSVLGDRDTLQPIADRVFARVQRAAGAAPLAVSLGDEISVTSHANPLDFCFDPRTLQAFRAELTRRFVTIAALNAAWGTGYADWNAVVPWTWDEMRARERGPGLPRNLAPWAMHRCFMNARLASDVAALAGLAFGADPRARVGFAGGQQPSAYGGSDYAQLLRRVNFVEVYDQGGTRELVASLLLDSPSVDARRFETIACPKPPEAVALLTEARVFDLLAHGLSGVCVWSAGDVFDGAGRTPFGEALAKVLPLVSGAWTKSLITERQRWSPVWILESQRSVTAHWALDARDDGATWVRRLSSYEATHSTSMATRLGWVRLCQDLGLQPRFVSETDLEAEDRHLGDLPRVLILPATVALSDQAADRIMALCRGGVTVVADQSPGWYDGILRLRAQPGLDALFGVRGRGKGGLAGSVVRDGRVAAGALRTADGLALHEPDLEPETGVKVEACGRGFVQMERSVERGSAVLLNCAVCEYPMWRLDPALAAQAQALRTRAGRVLERAGVAPWCVVTGQRLPACVEQIRFGDEWATTLVLRPHVLERPDALAALAAAGPIPVHVALPAEFAVQDLLTGRTWSATREFDLEIHPVRGAFLALQRR